MGSWLLLGSLSTLSMYAHTASDSSIPPTSLQFQKHSVTMFTCRAQLTFGISKSKEVNVADFFLNWFQESLTALPNFTLLPFHTESDGQPAPTPSEILPNDIKFFETYYANHRVLNHGNLTGMVQIKTSVSKSNIKSFKNPYFAWLWLHRVYLNYTKFKTDTLVACGFLVGAHHGYLRREEAEEEIRGSLSLEKDELLTSNCPQDRYLFPSRKETPSGSGEVANLVGRVGDTPFADAFIQGTITQPLPEHTFPGVERIVQTLARPYPIITQKATISDEEFVTTYRVARETTSSSPSGRHIGHYEAIVKHPALVSLHATMISIPFQSGYVKILVP
jgi:hypothetical protein